MIWIMISANIVNRNPKPFLKPPGENGKPEDQLVSEGPIASG
jgi:hypothetical protein